MSSIKKTRKPLNVANLYALYLGSRVLRINLVILPSQVLESVHDAAEQALLTAQHLCAVIEPHGMLDLLSTAVQRELCLVATSTLIVEIIFTDLLDHPSQVAHGQSPMKCVISSLHTYPLNLKICSRY